MKRLFFGLTLLVVTVVCFGQEQSEVVAETGSFWSTVDWGSVFNIGLGVLAAVFAGGFAFIVNKSRQLGKLLIAFADSVDDKRIDANERKDLALKVRELLGKN